jgi:hypothetical protein
MFEKWKKFRAEARRAEDPEKLARRVSETGFSDFVRYLHSPWRIIWSNFLAGVFRGLGFAIGATALLAVAVYIFVQILGNLPWVGEFFQGAGQLVQDIQSTAKYLGK